MWAKIIENWASPPKLSFRSTEIAPVSPRKQLLITLRLHCTSGYSAHFNFLSAPFKLWQRSAAKLGRSESNDLTLPLLRTWFKSMKMFSTQFAFISSSELTEHAVLGRVRALWARWDFLSKLDPFSASFDFNPKPSSNSGLRQKFFVPVRARKLSRFKSACSICDSSCFKISLGIVKSRSELSRELRDVTEAESKFEFKSFSSKKFRSWCSLCKLPLICSSLTSSSTSKLADFDVLEPPE